ncbi:MAG: hypothetical protein ABW221_20815 [Vicinamibacteria bacterium]
MPPGASALLLLAIPSLVALGLLAWDRRATTGTRLAVAYFGAVAAYGAGRGLAIRAVTGTALETPFPYLMNRPVAALFGVSLQELVGWAVAATLALRIAERLVRRGGPHRTAAVAALGLGCVCLAVESAAIASQWWTWTLALPDHGPLRVPPVAVLDWGFVAFDFLVPWLAFRSGAPLGTRAASLALFPLHMLGHTWFRMLPGPFPVTGYEVVHVAIVAYVAWRAVGEPGAAAPAPPPLPIWPAAGAAALVAGASTAACLLSGEPASALGVVPLALVAAVAFARGPRGREARDPSHGTRVVLRCGIAVLALSFLALVAAPQNRREQRLLAELRRGVERSNAGDLLGAETALRLAVEARADHAGARTLLALVLLRQGRTAAARAEIDAALRSEPTARDALLVGASLDLQGGDRARAAERAARGRRVYPANPEFAYLSLVARGEAGPGRPAAAEAVALARAAGPDAVRALAVLAERTGDAATAAACRAAP